MVAIHRTQLSNDNFSDSNDLLIAPGALARLCFGDPPPNGIQVFSL